MADWLTWDGGALTADVVTRVDVQASAEVTNHPVETGTTIADHIQRQPKTVSFDFAQSAQTLRDGELVWQQQDIEVRKSLFKPSGLLALTSAVGDAIGAGLEAIGLGGSPQTQIWSLTAKEPDKKRIEEIWEALVEVLDGGKECTFVWGDLVLTGYYLTAVRRGHQAGSGGLARFSLSAQHVQTVQTAQTSLLGGLPVPSILDALPLLNRGRKTAEKTAEGLLTRAADLGLNNLGGAL